jgi:hypothetical protein
MKCLVPFTHLQCAVDEVSQRALCVRGCDEYSLFRVILLVADARFKRAERFPEPGDDYNGALYFDPKTIRVFDLVPSDVVSRIWPEFKGFSHVKWTLDPKRYPDFERQLKHVETAKA